MVRFCAAGVVVPICQANESCAGVTCSAGVPPTLTTTGTLMPVVPGGLIATAAENGPEPPGNAAGFTVTCNWLGKFPTCGVTVSQFPPLFTDVAAVKLETLGLVLEIDTFCETGTVLPAAIEKLSEVGFADNGLTPPCELGMRVTGIERNTPAPLTLMKPVSVLDVGAFAPIETIKEIGVTPLLGVTNSQLVSENVDTVTFKGPFASVTKTVCAGVGTPGWVLNVNADGLELSGFVSAQAVSKQHTRISRDAAVQNNDFLAVFKGTLHRIRGSSGRRRRD